MPTVHNPKKVMGQSPKGSSMIEFFVLSVMASLMGDILMELIKRYLTRK